MISNSDNYSNGAIIRSTSYDFSDAVTLTGNREQSKKWGRQDIGVSAGENGDLEKLRGTVICPIRLVGSQ